MTIWHKIIADLTVNSEDSFVMRSQLIALKKQLPLLYLILNANSLALAYTHYASAPLYLTLLAPAILLPICVLRVVQWSRLPVARLTEGELRDVLRRTLIVVSTLGVAFTAWSLSLYPYGDSYAQSHVAFFMSITVIGCIFCLMHLRPAALILTLVVAVPFTARFLTTGNPVFTAIAVNFFLVSIIMVVILLTYYKDFRDLVHSQQNLAALSRENARIANLDSLTGVANRRSFFSDVQLMMDAHVDGQPGFVLGIVDLDGFKPINDVYGHGAGDQVLVEVGRRLQQTAGTAARIARLGGDEFGLVLPIVDAEAVLELGRDLCEAIRAPLQMHAGMPQVAASIGFAVFPDMAADREHLVELADYALYHAKEHSRGTAVLFTKLHQDAIVARSRIEQELRRADFATEIKLQFQPIVEISSARVVAFEALARWHSPVLGLVAPDSFVPACERIGLIKDLTQIVIRKACAAARSWPHDIQISLNLSVHDLVSEDAISRLGSAIRDSRLCPTRITLEVTETALMQDFDQARDTLLALKALGANVSLDDFGTGYSSLSYVRQLPLDKIKIDRSFVADVVTDQASRDIVTMIVDLARNLRIGCIVEGVEDAEQVVILRALGCAVMQGYYFAKPMDGDAIEAFLGANNPASERPNQAMSPGSGQPGPALATA